MCPIKVRMQGAAWQDGPVGRCPAAARREAPDSRARPILTCPPQTKQTTGVTYGRAPLVASLVTLGSPHGSLERYPFGRAEEALRGPVLDAAPPRVRTSSLQFANYFYPSAASFPGLRLTCICGDAAVGRSPRLPWQSLASENVPGAANLDGALGASKDDDGGGTAAISSDRGRVGRGDKLSAVGAWLCYVSYKSGCGRGDVSGGPGSGSQQLLQICQQSACRSCRLAERAVVAMLPPYSHACSLVRLQAMA